MAEPSIFADEWRECLRAHYTYVVRMNDRGTERTLRGVMLEAGFSEDEVRELYVLATAHVDDMPADFAPDTSVLAGKPEAEAAYVQAVISPAVVAPETVEPEPLAEVVGGELVEVEAAETGVITELPVVMDLVDDEAAAVEPADEDAPPNDPDITQLSLF